MCPYSSDVYAGYRLFTSTAVCAGIRKPVDPVTRHRSLHPTKCGHSRQEDEVRKMPRCAAVRMSGTASANTRCVIPLTRTSTNASKVITWSRTGTTIVTEHRSSPFSSQTHTLSLSLSLSPDTAGDVHNDEQVSGHRIARGRGVTGDPRGNLPTSSIVQHDSHGRKSRCDLAGNRTQS
ncbi:hypothetical protein PR048_014453, partial [Dryococelus australis]